MERDPRERERGVARSDVASLWIEFLLLPQKLEEHLADPATVPTPPDLISMFLEQAIVSHKSGLGTNSSANNLAKDAEPQGIVKTTSRTASLLCERAARVAVVMRHTLSDIESSIASELHQFILLKALIRHDKGRSLVHQCNLHRWLIHKALQSHPVGSASPNVLLPVNRLGPWIAGDNLSEVFHGIVNGGGDAPPPSAGDSRFEEERASVGFLEKALQEPELDAELRDYACHEADRNSERDVANCSAGTDQGLSTGYKCQVILDIAEVYFMRGRISKAHELFSKCGEMLTCLPAAEVETRKPEASNPHNFSPVPKDRLAGFLIACKMLLRASASGNDVEAKQTGNSGDMKRQSFVSAPTPTQWAIMASEQSRLAARTSGTAITSLSGPANGDSAGSEFSSGKENAGASMSGRTSTDTNGQSFDENNRSQLLGRRRKRTYIEEANGDVTCASSQSDDDESLRTSEAPRQINDIVNKVAEVVEMQVDGRPALDIKRDTAEGLLKEVDGKISENERREIGEGSSDGKHMTDNDLKGVIRYLGENVATSDSVDTKQVLAGVCMLGRLETKHFTDREANPPRDVFPNVDNEMIYASFLKQEELLVQTFVEDIWTGHLPWTYRLAVEKDTQLSKPVRSRLAACNVVRSVVEGAPLECFLRIRGHFVNGEDTIEFLMHLLQSTGGVQDDSRFATHGGRLVRSGSSFEHLAVKEERRVVTGFACRAHDLAMYVCCVINKPWCWGAALKQGLVSQADLPGISSQLPRNSLKNVDGSGVFLKAGNQSESSKGSSTPGLELLCSESDILLSFVQVESVHELEALLETIKKMLVPTNARQLEAVDESKDKSGQEGTSCAHGQSPVQSDLVKLMGNHSTAGKFLLRPSKPLACIECQAAATRGSNSGQCSSLTDNVAAILRRRALNALETANDVFVATRMYEMVQTLHPGDCDSAMMLWILERIKAADGPVSHKRSRNLPELSKGEETFPSLGLLDFVVLQLIEKEMWECLSEYCAWVTSFLSSDWKKWDSETEKGTDGPSQPGILREMDGTLCTGRGKLLRKRLLQTVTIAKTVGELIPLCISLQKLAHQNQFNEDVARGLASSLSQLFEEFLCSLVGVDYNGQVQAADDNCDRRKPLAALGTGPHLGPVGVPLISKITNSRVLTSLASLTAGWLQRCHVARLTTLPLAVERYGVLAGVTAGSLAVGSLPFSTSVLRPPRVSPEFGRDLFGVLLEGIIRLPGVVEGDREKGHRWLQGLADLAFEDEAHISALRLYLQAGAIRSSQYCDRASSMNRDIFTPWVIQRMVAACRAIGADLQAAILCQCLPVPDHETAFQILQENTLIMDRDAATYFECLWEVPILELLVHLHSRAGDEPKVTRLIGLLQQPALNVHNPPAIRQAHINTMEQRFLQRLAGELL